MQKNKKVYYEGQGPYMHDPPSACGMPCCRDDVEIQEDAKPNIFEQIAPPMPDTATMIKNSQFKRAEQNRKSGKKAKPALRADSIRDPNDRPDLKVNAPMFRPPDPPSASRSDSDTSTAKRKKGIMKRQNEVDDNWTLVPGPNAQRLPALHDSNFRPVDEEDEEYGYDENGQPIPGPERRFPMFMPWNAEAGGPYFNPYDPYMQFKMNPALSGMPPMYWSQFGMPPYGYGNQMRGEFQWNRTQQFPSSSVALGQRPGLRAIRDTEDEDYDDDDNLEEDWWNAQNISPQPPQTPYGPQYWMAPQYPSPGYNMPSAPPGQQNAQQQNYNSLPRGYNDNMGRGSGGQNRPPQNAPQQNLNSLPRGNYDSMDRGFGGPNRPPPGPAPIPKGRRSERLSAYEAALREREEASSSNTSSMESRRPSKPFVPPKKPKNQKDAARSLMKDLSKSIKPRKNIVEKPPEKPPSPEIEEIITPGSAQFNRGPEQAPHRASFGKYGGASNFRGTPLKPFQYAGEIPDPAAFFANRPKRRPHSPNQGVFMNEYGIDSAGQMRASVVISPEFANNVRFASPVGGNSPRGSVVIDQPITLIL